jgi:hypothetical protein
LPSTSTYPPVQNEPPVQYQAPIQYPDNSQNAISYPSYGPDMSRNFSNVLRSPHNPPLSYPMRNSPNYDYSPQLQDPGVTAPIINETTDDQLIRGSEIGKSLINLWRCPERDELEISCTLSRLKSLLSQVRDEHGNSEHGLIKPYYLQSSSR